jgi:hypothetical protein
MAAMNHDEFYRVAPLSCSSSVSILQTVPDVEFRGVTRCGHMTGTHLKITYSCLPSRLQADSNSPGSRSGSVDSQYRCSVVHAAAMLSELQNWQRRLLVRWEYYARIYSALCNSHSSLSC